MEIKIYLCTLEERAKHSRQRGWENAEYLCKCS